MTTFVATVGDSISTILMPTGMPGFHIQWREMARRVEEAIGDDERVVVSIFWHDGDMFACVLSSFSLNDQGLLMDSEDTEIDIIDISNIPRPTLFADGRIMFTTADAIYWITP